jgi:hypothetical protein
MDAFKEMAEDKMRDAVTKQVQGEIDQEEETYQSRESEFQELQTTDTRAEKRQMWMQSISGQNAPGQASTAVDPSALGARPNALGASAGRQMRGMLGAQAPQQPRMGLAGMRAPSTSSKPLTMPGAPLVKPIKSPLGAGAPQLAQPVQPKVVRTPLQPVNQLVQPKAAPQLEDVPLPAGKSPTATTVSEVPESTVEVEAAVAEEIQPVETMVDDPVEAIVEAAGEEVAEAMDSESAAMRPITKVMSTVEVQAAVKTTTLKPLPPQIMPKKARGAPPNIAREKEEPSKATLTPVKRMTTLNIRKADQDDEDESNQEA